MIRHKRKPADPPHEAQMSLTTKTVYLFKKAIKNSQFNWHPFKIEPNKSLHNHMLFWWPLCILIFLALALTKPFWCLCWPSPGDYEVLLKQLGFPLFVASLSIPISVAIGRFHASSQRALSNELTQENNAFNNFFSHRNHFMEYSNGAGIPKEFKGLIEVTDADLLYKMVFPQNDISTTNFRINKSNYKKQLQEKLNLLENYLNQFLYSIENDETNFSPDEFESFAREIPNMFGFVFSDQLAQFYCDYDKRTSTTFFEMCLKAIRDTLLSMHSFNHIQTVGYVIELEFKPYFDSLIKSEAMKGADVIAARMLVFSIDVV